MAFQHNAEQTEIRTLIITGSNVQIFEVARRCMYLTHFPSGCQKAKMNHIPVVKSISFLLMNLFSNIWKMGIILEQDVLFYSTNVTKIADDKHLVERATKRLQLGRGDKIEQR
jgi:hypothetical protein